VTSTRCWWSPGKQCRRSSVRPAVTQRGETNDCLLVRLPVRDRRGEGLYHLILEVVTVAAPMNDEIETGIEDCRRIARMRSLPDAGGRLTPPEIEQIHAVFRVDADNDVHRVVAAMRGDGVV